MSTVIESSDSFIQAIDKMADGNIAAMTWLLRITSGDELKRIDPDCPNSLMLLLTMDLLEIRGVNIWYLFKYCCEQDTARTLAAIRAAQMELVPRDEFMKSVEKGERMDYIALVQKELPRFGQEESK